MTDLATLCRKRLNDHETTLYEAGASTVFDDPDGGVLRYGRALHRVLSLCDSWDDGGPRDPVLLRLIEQCREAVAFELGITQAPPPGSETK